MVARVSYEPVVTGEKLNVCWLWLDIARVLWEWWEGESETSEGRSGDVQQWWRERINSMLCAPLIPLS